MSQGRDGVCVDVRGVTHYFGGLRALSEVNIQIRSGELVGLIGANGAGKTTLFNLIAGAFTPTQGEIWLWGQNVTGLPVHQRCQLGVGRTFQVPRPIRDVSVLDNVVAAALVRTRDTHAARRRALEVLEHLHLLDLKDQAAGTLNVAYQKRLEIAKALATQPSLLLLDEVLAGLNPTEQNDMIDIIRGINEGGVTIILVEHILHVVMSLARRVVVLDRGQVIADDKPLQVANNPRVIESYMGSAFV